MIIETIDIFHMNSAKRTKEVKQIHMVIFTENKFYFLLACGAIIFHIANEHFEWFYEKPIKMFTFL